MKQIKIENNGVEQLITVPENSKVTIDGNVVVFEPKFKKGDCVIGKDSNYPKMAKFVEFVKDECVCRYDNNSRGCNFKYLRLATIEEKNETLSDLKAEGKQWNAEKLCIEDLKWNPKIGELFYYFDDELDLCSDAYNKLGYSITIKCGNCFKTKELCQQAIDKIKQVLSEK